VENVKELDVVNGLKNVLMENVIMQRRDVHGEDKHLAQKEYVIVYGNKRQTNVNKENVVVKRRFVMEDFV